MIIIIIILYSFRFVWSSQVLLLNITVECLTKWLWTECVYHKQYGKPHRDLCQILVIVVVNWVYTPKDMWSLIRVDTKICLICRQALVEKAEDFCTPPFMLKSHSELKVYLDWRGFRNASLSPLLHVQAVPCWFMFKAWFSSSTACWSVLINYSSYLGGSWLMSWPEVVSDGSVSEWFSAVHPVSLWTLT